MRFLTWNIQAGGGDRVSLILDEIERLSPDVVALSEVTYNNLEELRRRLCEQGLNHIGTTSRAGGPNSVLIASKLPFTVTDESIEHDPERWLAVELEDPDLKVLCVHVPGSRDNKFGRDGIGLSGKRRKEVFWDQLIQYAQRNKGERVILLGDFNTGLPEDAQGTPFVFSDRIKILRLERYVDSWRHHNPKAKEYTYFSTSGSKKEGTSQDLNGFRLDYVFVSSALRESIVKSVHVHSVRIGDLSDHSIVVTDLSIGAAASVPELEETPADSARQLTSLPPEYVEGWGELIRAYRKYFSISQRAMSERLSMSERSFSDIETGRRPCPPGLLDSIQALIAEFDSAVANAVQAAREAAAAQTPAAGKIPVDVGDEADGAWGHAVLCRAAVKGGLLLPVRTSKHRAGWQPRI